MKRFIVVSLSLLLSNSILAQKSIKEYVDDNGRERIMKSIAMPPGCQPTTAKGNDDGHGKNPLLFYKNQLPDTVALATMYIYDLGTTTQTEAGHWLYTEKTFVSAEGGNYLANEIVKETMAELRESFKRQGVVLLTPDQYLNTAEKRNYYYKTFTPQISKLGNFLSGIENKNTDIAVAADGYRPFDIAAANDYLRAESMGGDLAGKLGVDGILNIAVELQTDRRDINIHGVKMVLHGPNPIAREDKKYIGQKVGSGYYAGQIFAAGSFFFKKPIEVASYKKKEGLQPPNFTGLATIFGSFVDRFYDEMNDCLTKAAKKYDKL